jgi:hypothetical protein
MSFARWLFNRPRIDYLILILAFLFVSSNHVFENTLLRPTGSVDMSYGSAVPQVTNSTITHTVVPSVTSAVLFNHSIKDSVYFEIPFESLNWIEFDLTLGADTNNTAVQYTMTLGDSYTTDDVILSAGVETFSFTPDVTDFHPPASLFWLVEAHVSVDAFEDISASLVVRAQYSEPVCPFIVDLQSTNGSSLFENELTRLMYFDYRPDLYIGTENSSYLIPLKPTLVNQTYYMKPDNYSCRATWGYSGEDQDFNMTVIADEGTFCVVRMKAVRLYISSNIDLPLVKLTISRYSNWIYRDIFLESSPPEFIYVPGFSYTTHWGFELASPEFFSRYIDHSEDVRAYVHFEYNSTQDIHIDVRMPFLRLGDFAVTPQDLIRIILAFSCFFMIVVRIGLYLYEKRPLTSWQDIRLIPAIILFACAFLPWFSSVRDYGYPIGKLINMSSLGPFPLVFAGIRGSMSLVVLPANGFAWSVVSLLFFWIPLLLVLFRYSSPSNIQRDTEAILVLFAPFIFLFQLGYDLPNVFYSPTTVFGFLDYVLLLIPVIWAFVVAILWITGKYSYGVLENQLKHDFELSLMQEEKEPETTQESKIEKKPPQEPMLTLRLVFYVIAMLDLVLPSIMGSTYVYDYSIFSYRLDTFFFDNPLAGGTYALFHDLFPGGSWLLLILLVAPYYMFTAAILYDMRVKSRTSLNFLLLIVWAIMPFVAFSGFVNTRPTLHVAAWLCIGAPYALLSLFAIWKEYLYVTSKTGINSALLWIALSIISIFPGWWILSTLTDMLFAGSSPTVTIWTPLPIVSIMLLLFVWPISAWAKHEQMDSEETLVQNDISK